MIRINLLGGERKVVAARKAFTFGDGQKITIGCSVLLIATALFVAWRYWAIQQESVRLDQEISQSQKEAVRLRTILGQVQQFEQHKIQLQQRVTLIEQLRREQTGPVHILDQISRALPPLLWLTELKQAADPNEVLINGKCSNITALTDFVSSLEASGYFKRSIKIVNSQTEVATSTSKTGDLVSFSIRAVFQRPGDPVEAAPAPGSKPGTPAAAAAPQGTPRG